MLARLCLEEVGLHCNTTPQSGISITVWWLDDAFLSSFNMTTFSDTGRVFIFMKLVQESQSITITARHQGLKTQLKIGGCSPYMTIWPLPWWPTPGCCWVYHRKPNLRPETSHSSELRRPCPWTCTSFGSWPSRLELPPWMAFSLDGSKPHSRSMARCGRMW